MSANTQGASAPIVPSVLTIEESRLINQALRLIESKRVSGRRVLHAEGDLTCYLVLRFGGLLVEEFHVLYLDSSRCLLAAETVAVGDQKSVTPNFRNIAFRAISLGADSIVLAHNHPNNDLTPSQADLNQLAWAEQALRWLKIEVLDSFVVNSNGIKSIKRYRAQMEERRLQCERDEMHRRRLERSEKIRATRARKAIDRAEPIAAQGVRHD